MAGMTRQSSFLPTIKCSSCGDQIEISLMGEHVCRSGKDQPPLPEFDSFKPWNKAVHEKIGRVPLPPKVDTLAANRTYYRAGQLTPVSNSSGSASRSASPRTPSGRPGRSDDYFPPKIANEPGGLGGLDGLDDQLCPSPKKQAPNLLQRMNSIAPGPFELNSKRTGARNASRSGDGADQHDGFGGMPPTPASFASLERPRTSNSNASFGSSGQQQAPRMPTRNGYGGFGPPQRLGSQDDVEPQPLSTTNRAGTFPLQSDAADPLLRTPSAPGPRPDRMRRPDSSRQNNPPPHAMNGSQSRRPSNDSVPRRPSIGPDTSRPPPPRKSVINRPQTRDGSMPPEINLAMEFGIGNPYHSPNPSMSSSTSSSSRPSQRSGSQSQPSTRPSHESSPERSLRTRDIGRGVHARNPSSVSNGHKNVDGLVADLQSSMEGLGSGERDLPQPPLDKGDGFMRSGSRGRGRGVSDPDRSGSIRVGSQLRGREPTGVSTNRGSCKACGDPISGKSISSADGRLTGRYHKACFVCATCRDPFSSSTFYVHDDKPYCERDWHKANRSLCGSCDVGIEGQYLADETDRKFHPECFRCGDCGTVLRDGYFEVAGGQYCEKDAWRRTQQQTLLGLPGGAGGRLATPSSISSSSGGSYHTGRNAGGPRFGMPLAANGLPGGPKGFAGNGFSRPGSSGLPGGGKSTPEVAGTGLPGGRPFGLPSGNRLGPRPRMEKRMTRLGMM